MIYLNRFRQLDQIKDIENRFQGFMKKRNSKTPDLFSNRG